MAEKQKPKAKPTPEKMTKAEQSERFKETARKLGSDESGEAFERALEKIVPRNNKSMPNVAAIALTSFKGSDITTDGLHGCSNSRQAKMRSC